MQSRNPVFRLLSLTLIISITLLNGCSNPPKLLEKEKAYGTRYDKYAIFHRIAEADRGLGLKYPGFLVGIEKGDRKKIDPDNNYNKIVDQLKKDTTSEKNYKRVKDILGDGKITFVSHIAQYRLKSGINGNPYNGIPYIEENILYNAYRMAVEDASRPEASEISNKLTPITDYNKDLIWDGEPGKSRVLVVTWTSYDGYDDKEGQTLPATRDTWVSVVPELKDFISNHGLRNDTLTLRLEQLLGLPPKNSKTRFVELWVETKDLFRPSPDPEIIDREADLQFPNSRFMTVSPNHIEWINNLRETSYGEDGYPWTQLGYTYDWGGDTNNDIGLSEFVIIKDAQGKVHSVTLNENYGK